MRVMSPKKMPGAARSLLGRLISDRTGATLVVFAVMTPALLVGMAFALETSLIQVRRSQLQTVADAAAGAAREKLDPYTSTPPPDGQEAPIDEAVRIAGLSDLPTSIARTDVVEGWWDITSKADDKFGGTVAGQTGLPFSNAIRVTAREDHQFIMGALIGKKDIQLSAQATAYKCSNLDYPLTRIPDDPFPPSQPAIYYSWETPGHDASTSYYFDNPVDGRRNPIIKFWSPTDGQDVSFVVFNSDGSAIQVDTYCRGTFLVIPDAFDWGHLGSPITGQIYRGSTNNSFALYPDQSDYPVAYPTTTYNNDSSHLVPLDVKFLDPSLVHTTPYPSSLGIQYWASEGDPTPDRRTLLVR